MRRALVVGGTLIMAYAVFGAMTDRDGRPVAHLLFLAGVLLAHDAVLMPVAIGVGALIGRFVPVAARAGVRAAAFITAALLVVAVPLVLGYGRRPDDPSALPLDYGRGLAAALTVVWAAALTGALRDAAVLRRAQKLRRRTGAPGERRSRP